MTWYSDFNSICRADVPLAGYTWYHLGGPARWMIEPRSVEQLAAVVRRLRDEGIPWRVLGRGANVLIRDAGFDGAVIRLSAPDFQTLHVNSRVRCAAGHDLPRLIRACIANGRVGLEALAGIPATLGGAVRMNAGGKYGQLGQFVSEVEFVDADGQTHQRPADQVGFAYRATALPACIVTVVTLELPDGDAATARRRYREIWTEKAASQPAVAQRSAGCIFKNPPDAAAGALIDRVGLKGHRIGDARISKRHANFIVAGASATAADVLALIDLARERVLAETGIELQLEVQVW